MRLVRELVAAYERQGEPQPALDYLGQHCRRSARPDCLKLLAELAERAGKPTLAIDTWQALLKQPGQLNPARALRLALLLLAQGRGEEGYRWLSQTQSQSGQPNSDNADYWRLNGQMAEFTLDTAGAVRIYRHLIDAGQGTLEDYDALLRLIADEQPDETALLASLAWRRFGESRHLMQALNLYASRERWSELGRLIGEAEKQQGIRQNPDFLRLAAAYYQHNDRTDIARRYLEQGLRLAPESFEMQQALLWLLIDGNDASGLRKLLGRHESAWQRNPALHDSLAAAYQALSQPKVALTRYLKPHLNERRDDFLWLMNYADALEQDQRSDQAWRLRRWLLSNEWQAAGRPSKANGDWLSDKNLDNARRIARARLILTQRRGDPALATLRELLRLDRNGNAKLSDAAVETAIGWLQDHAEFNAERGFLWQQYGRSRGQPNRRPLWAEITESLASRDKGTTGELLARFDERLPRYDRVNAALAVDDLRLAQSAAFETQDAQDDDEPLQMQLTESLLAFSNQADVAYASRNLAIIDERASTAGYHLAINPSLSLDFEWGRVAREVRDNNIFAAVPDEEVAGARLHWRQNDGDTQLRIERRESFSDYTPLQLTQHLRIDDRLSLDFSLGRSLPSQESIALRIAGMKNQAAVALNYLPTRLDQIQVEHRRESYRLQDGEALGDGSHTTISYTHNLRQELSDLLLSAFWSTHQFSQEALSNSGKLERFHRDYLSPVQKGLYADPSALPSNYFVPDSFRFYGLRIATNMRLEQEYTRAWRPFGSLGLTHHSALGSGYDVRLGVAGSVFGADHFAVSGGLAKSGMQTGGIVREVQMTYRIHY